MATTQERSALTFDVTGMTCAACARRVERTLAEQPGVSTAAVNYAVGRATVETEPDVVADDLVRAVEHAGYGLVPHEIATSHGGHGEHDHGIAIGREDELTRVAFRRFLLAAVLTVPLFALAMAGYMEAPWSYVQLGLATMVEFWAGRQFLISAWKQARHRSSNMDTLIAVGTLAAYLYSVYSLFGMGGDLYFETAGVIITFLLLGKFLEHRSKSRASRALTALLELGAKSARVLRDGIEVEVPVEDVEVGDLIRVRPGEKIAVDALVREGRSAIDESALTGESVPVDKEPGAEVYGGTVNTSGALLIEARKVGADTMLMQIVRLVEEAQGRKAPIEKLADKVSSIFVPVVILIAATTLGVWLLLGNPFEQSLLAAVAVLIIACPCALGLATPAALMVGTGRGATLGIVIKGGDVLERVGKIDSIVLDKTGTLTRGDMKLVAVATTGATTEEEALSLAAGVEELSEHPIARAIADGARERGLALPVAIDFRADAGAGASAVVDGRRVAIGRRSHVTGEVSDDLEARATELERDGSTLVWLSVDGSIAAVFAVADTLKPTARRAVERLHELGLETVLMTGDRAVAAEAIGARVGVQRVLSEVLPQDKAAEVARLQSEGRKVAMVGDGVNDAPALAQADLGIAIGTGTDVAIEASDVTLVGGEPLLAPAAIELARRTLRTIKENLAWAFLYNVLMIPLAAFGLLEPIFAAAAMALSSVSVVLNALRLRRFRTAQ